MGTFIDLTGKRFGYLLVLWRLPNNKDKRAMWHCFCDCGKFKNLRSNVLVNNLTTSCGCQGKLTFNFTEKYKVAFNKHPLASICRNAHARCYDKNSRRYKDYGGRGIKLFPLWKKYLCEMAMYIETNLGKKPGPEYSLDRIDNNKGYEPGNLRWATIIMQNRNKRNTPEDKRL